MLSKFTLKNVMTSVPYTISPETSLIEAQKEMRHHNVRHLPVTKSNDIVGILSERDISSALSLAKHAVEEESLTAGDMCRTQPYTVEIDERLDRVFKYMGANKVGSALVTDKGSLVGILTTTDICRACGHLLEELFESNQG